MQWLAWLESADSHAVDSIFKPNSTFRRPSLQGLGCNFVCQRTCFPSTRNRTATWDVEGLQDKDGTKLDELTYWMANRGVGILCLQETHEVGSAYFTHKGFLVILSGAEGNVRSWAGVGFIVSPHLKDSVQSFLQYTDRLASLRLRVPGGQLCLVSAYAPAGVKDFDTRHDFFQLCFRVYSFPARPWSDPGARRLQRSVPHSSASRRVHARRRVFWQCLQTPGDYRQPRITSRLMRGPELSSGECMVRS